MYREFKTAAPLKDAGVPAGSGSNAMTGEPRVEEEQMATDNDAFRNLLEQWAIWRKRKSDGHRRDGGRSGASGQHPARKHKGQDGDAKEGR